MNYKIKTLGIDFPRRGRAQVLLQPQDVELSPPAY